MTAGERLRALREGLGLTIRDVESASAKLSAKHHNPELSISLSRLSDIETKGVVPTVFKLYALAAIYRRSIDELLLLYGLNTASLAEDIHTAQLPKTHTIPSTDRRDSVNVPVRVAAELDLRATNVIGQLIQRWGTVPLAYLERFTQRRYSYGFVGTEDWTMFPLLLPGSFIQIDESRNKIVEGGWCSEYERPIYFLETRDGHTCCWCDTNGTHVTLRPHPLSPEKSRVLKLDKEVEVIGQVVGVAMRLDGMHHEQHHNGHLRRHQK